MSWDLIIPFLRPIEAALKDVTISDILINGDGRIFVEKSGQLTPQPDITISEKSLQVAVRNIARLLGDDISEENPLLDARLPDGSRVAAIIPPCSPMGTIFAIRKFQARYFSADALVQVGTITAETLALLQRAVSERKNIMISGGTGTGKTTLLTALLQSIAPNDRVVVIEDTSEIQLANSNVVRLEARRAQEGLPAISVRNLLRTCLRLRPDRIILGEVRDGDAFDLLQALNCGHAGTISTIHANAAELAISRFATCVLQSGIELPYRAIRSNIAEALQIIVHLDRINGRRIVTNVIEVRHYEPETDRFSFEALFSHHHP